MALTNTTKPTTSYTNSARIGIAETWGSIPTTWASETRTWEDTTSLITNEYIDEGFDLWSALNFPWLDDSPWIDSQAVITNQAKP